MHKKKKEKPKFLVSLLDCLINKIFLDAYVQKAILSKICDCKKNVHNQKKQKKQQIKR